MGRQVHGADPDVVEREGDEGPPDHGLVDVDAPGGQDVAYHECVAEALKHNVIVILAA